MKAQDAGGATLKTGGAGDGILSPVEGTSSVPMEAWGPWSFVLREGLEVGVGIGLFKEESDEELPGLRGASASWSAETAPSKM